MLITKKHVNTESFAIYANGNRIARNDLQITCNFR